MIKASIILTAAFFISWLLRKRSAAERHLVLIAAVIAAGVLPVLSLLLPAWQPSLAQRVVDALPSIPSMTAPADSHTAQITFRAYAIESTDRLTRFWPIAWLGGSVVVLLIFGAGIVQQRRYAARSLPLSDPELESMLMKSRRAIRLRRSLDEPMPMTWGIFRPEILFPNSVDHWPAERKRIVLAHELAHVRRFDYLFQILAQIACAAYWFNPLFWIASGRLQRESEHASDDAVINLGVEAREYASHLLAVARLVKQSGALSPATLAMARPSTLERRFKTLLRTSRDRSALTRTGVFCAAAITLIIVLPLAAMRLSDNHRNNPNAAVPKIEQYTTPPLYSDEARERGIEGVVTVDARIGVDGRPTHLEVAKGLGHGLDENALLAVRDWRFVPASRNGSPIEAATRVDVEFNLRNAELNEEIANDMATRIGPGVTPPQVIHRVEPEHSQDRTMQVPAGAVVLDAVILEGGTAKIVRVIQSQGWELDESAINALKQWRFSPAMKDDEPVKVRMNIAVSFSSNRV